jgi:NTP pyrophosphatase (non-canonical NTP hydrolase)
MNAKSNVVTFRDTFGNTHQTVGETIAPPNPPINITVNVAVNAYPEVLSIRPEVAKFAQAMEDELKANDHKGGWDKDTVAALLDRAQDELFELREAVALRFSDETILSEAADTANFVMMVAENYRKQGLARYVGPKT